MIHGDVYDNNIIIFYIYYTVWAVYWFIYVVMLTVNYNSFMKIVWYKT